MANAARGEVEVGGYTLRYDINALCEAEDVAGENIADIIESMADKTPSFSRIRLLFWAGARSSKPELTMEEAGAVIQSVGVVAAVAAVGKAIERSLGPGEEGTTRKNQ